MGFIVHSFILVLVVEQVRTQNTERTLHTRNVSVFEAFAYTFLIRTPQQFSNIPLKSFVNDGQKLGLSGMGL